ncbi:UNVERIFIED_ORG: hypothetical protein EDC92_1475 [Dietzia maris]|jgi:hypothetical protein|uniref:hypothetical protein n=1 Tax=Dietzia TaxID=37914 RepID=UPI00104A5D1F|nr:hypothetical protein [Dietzia cinnamea]MBB0993350.1 hypothetical protein [Dietzia sp. SLG510A3-40A3]MBB1009376.1 hypothetical protein [Dietzia sp. SLG510A3-3B2-2]MCT2138629.1 hypothetical protein [Dietzia cinnamea]
MRSLSGTRNRIALTVAALLILAAAVWLIAASFALAPAGAPLSGLVPTAEQSVAAIAAQHRGWLLPAATVASVVAVLAGLGLLAAQIPTAPAHTPLRLPGDDGSVLATLQPQVLERALAERAEAVPGIKEASVRVSGSTTSLRLLAQVAVAEDAQVEWAVARVRWVLADDPATALGTAALSVDVLLRLHNPRSSSRSGRSAVGQDAPDAALVTSAG